MGFTPDAPKGFTPDAAPAAPSFTETQNQQNQQPTGDLKGALSGLAELFGTRLSNIPGGALHGIHDIVSRVATGQPAPAYKPDFVPSENAKAVSQSISEHTPNPYTVGDLLNLIPGVKEFHDTYIAPVKQDVGQIGAGASAVNPLYSGARAAASGLNEAIAAPTIGAGIGLQSATESPFTAGAAGPGGLEALAANNRPKATTALFAEAGVPHDSPKTSGALEGGREQADAVANRAAAAMPQGPIAGTGRATIENAGPASNIVTRSDAAQATIDQQKQRLLNGNFSGDDVMANLRSLRKQGYARIASENPEDWDIGKAQLDMAGGLEQHIDEQLKAANADVSMAQIKAARVTQAKNSALQAAMKGSNIDFQAIARMANADPNKFTGVFKDITDFTNAHPKVMQMPPEVPPSYLNDLGKSVRTGGAPQDVVARLFGAAGVPAGARRLLTGGAPDLTAAQRVPVAGLGGEFDPLDNAPKAPPGMTASPPTAPPPAAAGPPGQIPLADVLSHGVPPSPAPGLTAGPMGAPAPEGIPFTVPPESIGAKIVKGRPGVPPATPASRFVNDEEIPTAPEPAPASPLGSRFSVAPDQPPLSGYPGVKSQGVPEGIVQKTQQPSAPGAGPQRGPMPIVGNSSGLPPDQHNALVMQQVRDLVQSKNEKMAASGIPDPHIPGGYNKILQHMVDNLDPTDPVGAFHKDLAERLMPFNTNTSLRMPKPGTPSDTWGRTTLTAQGNLRIALNNLAKDPLTTVNHEAVHAATMEQLENDPKLQDSLASIMTQAQDSPAVQALSKRDRYGVEATRKVGGDPNPHEIVAEATANPRLQDALRKSPSPTNPGQSLYDDYKKAIGTSLKLPPTVYNDPRFEKVLNGFGSGSSVA